MKSKNKTKKPEIYVISDTHFDHSMLVEAGLRPDNFNELIWKGLTVLKPNDMLLHLGDVSLGNDNLNHEKICGLPCHKTLILGNHDKRGLPWYLSRGWNCVAHKLELIRHGTRCIFTHEPIPPRNDWSAHGPNYNDTINIHGHLHLGIHRAYQPSRLHLCISLEALGYNPIPLKSLVLKRDIYWARLQSNYWARLQSKLEEEYKEKGEFAFSIRK